MNTIDKAKTRLLQAYGGPGESLDPNFITLLLDLAQQALRKCLESRTAAQVLQASKGKGLAARWAVRRVVADNAADLGFFEISRIVEAVLEAGARSTAADLKEFAALEVI